MQHSVLSRMFTTLRIIGPDIDPSFMNQPNVFEGVQPKCNCNISPGTSPKAPLEKHRCGFRPPEQIQAPVGHQFTRLPKAPFFAAIPDSEPILCYPEVQRAMAPLIKTKSQMAAANLSSTIQPESIKEVLPTIDEPAPNLPNIDTTTFGRVTTQPTPAPVTVSPSFIPRIPDIFGREQTAIYIEPFRPSDLSLFGVSGGPGR